MKDNVKLDRIKLMVCVCMYGSCASCVCVCVDGVSVLNLTMLSGISKMSPNFNIDSLKGFSV